MLDRINALAAEISALTASSAAEVEELRIKYLSKKGLVSALFNDFRTVPADQKREIGQAINDLKNLATDKINALRDALSCADSCDDTLDLTRSAAPIPLGTRHPLSIVREEIIDIFRRLGFTMPKAPRLKTTGTCSRRSTSPKTTPPATCKTLSSSTACPTCCSAPTPRRCKPA